MALSIALFGLAFIVAMALVTWIASVVKRDASIVDGLWSIYIAGAGIVYAILIPATGPRTGWVLALAIAWALRLAAHVTWRNWGEPEDYRYRAIRARNEPNYALKSVYLVFGLQSVLAWLVSLPLLAAIASSQAPGLLDAIGAAIVVFGIVFETVADWQLARFKADPASKGRVLDSGLWRYSRHPNYFGEFCVWWGFFAIALGAGGWWSVASPIVMSVLLLKVSGVTLLEKDIGERRPGYREYVASTPVFFPGLRRRES